LKLIAGLPNASGHVPHDKKSISLCRLEHYSIKAINNFTLVHGRPSIFLFLCT
jgi:hypothetical protein